VKVWLLIITIILLSCHGVERSTVQRNNYTKDLEAKNVLGKSLMSCCTDPLTGFYRDGHCYTGPQDYGTHVVCARMTTAFLEYSKSQGNDLITPLPARHFPGLVAGDYWCLCISRWVEAMKAGVAPPIKLEATHEKALSYVSIQVLESYAIAKQN